MGPLAAFGPTLALTLTLAVACFVVVLSVVELLTSPKPLPPPLPGAEKQGAETALYAITFVLILPAAVMGGPRLADTIAAGPNAGALSSLAALLSGTLAASLLVTRVLPGGGGVAEALAAFGVWWVAAVGVLVRATRGRPWEPLSRVAPWAPLLWRSAAVLLLVTPLCFAATHSISPLALVLGALAVAAVLVLYARGVRVSLPRWWGAGFDAVSIVLIMLAVPDLVIYKPVHEGTGPVQSAAETSVLQLHQDFVLGPANVLMHGGAMLVDAASQYGVGSIYLLAAWFKLTSIGYGTLGLLDGALFALVYAAGYCILRLAGTSRPLAAGALVLGVLVLIYNLFYPVGGLAAQHGPLRFGLPMLVILATVAETARPRWARAAWVAQLVVVGMSSIWAVEAFAYTVLTFAAVACFEAVTRSDTGRLRWLARRGALAGAACVAAHLLLIAGTLARSGQLPDYGWYLAFLREFLFGSVGELTFDFSPWSAGLAVGGVYAASAVAFILVVRRRPEVVERERPALVALAGTTAYGIVLFSYFVNRSADHILPYVSLPALLAGTLWLSLLLRSTPRPSRSLRLTALALGMGVAVLLTSVAWSSIGERFDRSALGRLLPGGESARAAVRKLRHLPALDRRAPQGEYLLDRYMPGQQRVLTLVAPDLELEVLMRSDRANKLPLAFPTEDSFVSSHYVPDLRRATAELRPGDRLLTQVPAVKHLAAIRKPRNVLSDPDPRLNLAPLQEWVLQRIDERFRLRILHRDGQGYVVAVLEPR